MLDDIWKVIGKHKQTMGYLNFWRCLGDDLWDILLICFCGWIGSCVFGCRSISMVSKIEIVNEMKDEELFVTF